MSRRIEKTLSVLLCAILAVLMIVPNTQKADASTASELRQQIAEKDEEIAAQQKKLDALSSSMGDVQDDIDALTEQTNLLSEQINDYSLKLILIQKEIDAAQEKIDATEKEADETESLLCERLRAMYIAGDSSTIEIILTAGSFEELLTRIELVRNISASDTALIKKYRSLIDELNAQKKLLESDKADLESDKKVLDEKAAVLETQKSTLNSKLAILKAQNKNISSYQSKLEDQKEEYLNELVNTLGGSTGNGGNGELIWPVPYNDSYITSYYGYRIHPITGKNKPHPGIDISRPGAGSYTTKIVAAESGTVTYSQYNSGGYGNLVLIDNGQGRITAYGHCYKLLVSVGQKVSQGQNIAIMGSTGDSTGPHCHFEVRLRSGNGYTTVNPLNYVSAP